MLKGFDMVDGQTKVPEEPMSGPHSIGSSYRYSSQSRKISIGVLVDSITKAETKEALMQIGGNAHGTGSCVKECDGFTPLVQRNLTVLHKETSPWVSPRNSKLRKSSVVASHVAEHVPVVPAASTGQLGLGSKQPVKAPVNGKCRSESDQCMQSKFCNDTFPVEVAVGVDAKKVNNGISFTNPKASLVNEQLEEKNGKTLTDGRENLRMKLWEILGDVSSPNKCVQGSQFDELHPHQERDEKHSSHGKRILFSDTIESDSERPDYCSRKAVTSLLQVKKASTNTRHKRIGASKSNRRIKESPKERVFSFREEFSAAYANVNDGFLPSKRYKSEIVSCGVKKNQLKVKCAEGRQQSSNKSKSKAGLDICMVHNSKSKKVGVSNNRRNDKFGVVHSDARKKISSKHPIKMVLDLQKDDEQTGEVKLHELNNGPENIKDSLLKNKRNSLHDTPVTIFEVNSPGCQPDRKHDLCQADQLDGRHKRSNVDFVKPSFTSGDDNENGNSMSSAHMTDSEKSEDASPAKDCRESEPISPEICVIKKFVSGLESVENQKVTLFTPGSETVRETRIEETGELETYLEQNHEDGLANAVALLALALDRVETKLKSMTSKRSAEILQAAAEKIFLQLQTAKSQIKLDVEKLTGHGQPKKKMLETKFEEQRHRLIKVYEKFKKEFDQQLQHYDSIFGDLEDHEIELKRTAEKYRAGHKRFLLEVEQEIKVHLDDAESRIIAVHKLAKERLLQLKFALAKCINDDAFN